MPLIRAVISLFRWFWPAPPTDHRGRRVKVAIHPLIPSTFTAQRLGIPKTLVRQFTRAGYVVGFNLMYRVFVLLYLVHVLGSWTVQLVFKLTSSELLMTSGQYTVAIRILFAVTSAFLFMVTVYRHGSINVVHAMLRDRYCPNCGYNLESSQRAPDNCTVCPECQAAWRLPSSVS